MKRTVIKGRVLEFDADTHEYIYDGVLLPSVTSVLDNSKYLGVNKSILKASAEYGTMVHRLIEEYEVENTVPREIPIELRNYLFLKRVYGFKPMYNELPLVIWHNEEPVLAGTCDLVSTWLDYTCIEDYKVRASVDKEQTALQLNLYKIGVEQSYGIKVDKLFVIQLKGTTRRRAELPVNKEYAQSVLIEKLKNERGIINE